MSQRLSNHRTEVHIFKILFLFRQWRLVDHETKAACAQPEQANQSAVHQ